MNGGIWKLVMCLAVAALFVPLQGVHGGGSEQSIVWHEEGDDAVTMPGATPEAWDWRNVDGDDWTTPIRDQVQDACGSCWAFGALGGLEAMIKIWNDDPGLAVDLSEQYMLSCSPGDCGGWYWFSTLNWVQHNGAIPEACLPYEADDTIPCDAKCEDWREQLVGIESYHRVASDPASIQSALVEYGPLPASMDVYADFYPEFDGGVYVQESEEYVFGHCVTIVGYDTTWGDEDEGYWIVKNSWGTGWGEDGWFRIAYGECNIQQSVYYYEGPNYPPGQPGQPEGSTRGKPGETYTYTATASDAEDDDIRYTFDWGDGNITRTGYVASGTAVSVNYSWAEKGTYDVRVRAEDEHGLDGNWSKPLPVSMPKQRPGMALLEQVHVWLMQLLHHMLPA